MSKRVRNLTPFLAFALLATLLLTVFSGCSKDQPTYNNIPISVYLERVTKSIQQSTVDQAVQAIGAIGEPGAPWVLKAWKKNDDSDIRCRLASAIYSMGAGASSLVPVLTKALDAIDEQRISCAAYALSGIGPAAAPAAQKLGNLLKSSDTSTQINVLAALGAIGMPAKDEVPLIMEAVERERTRTAAIDALGKIGSPAVAAVQVWLDKGDQYQKLAALQILGQASAGDQLANVLPKLAALLKDKDPKVRLAAVHAIAKAGVGALPVQEDLIQALNDKNENVRNGATQALVNIGPDGGVDRIIKALDDPHALVRAGAAIVIGRYSTLVQQAEKELIRHMGDSDVQVRMASIDALTSIGPSIVPTMIRHLSNKNVLMQFGAARILGNLGSASRKALPELRKLLSANDALLRTEAQNAMSKIQ